MVWLSPKTSWTPNDFYNFEDLNRVENNTLIVVELLRKIGVNLSQVNITDRNIESIEFADSLNRIESNIEQLSLRFKPPNWVPSKMDWLSNINFNYEDANRLEHNLFILYGHYKGNIEAIPNCGVFICGEEVI